MNKEIKKSTINLIDRTNLTITGVNKIESLNKCEFIINTSLGHLKILGQDLTMDSFDNIKEVLIIKGKIDIFYYYEHNNKTSDSFIKRLLK